MGKVCSMNPITNSDNAAAYLKNDNRSDFACIDFNLKCSMFCYILAISAFNKDVESILNPDEFFANTFDTLKRVVSSIGN